MYGKARGVFILDHRIRMLKKKGPKMILELKTVHNREDKSIIMIVVSIFRQSVGEMSRTSHAA